MESDARHAACAPSLKAVACPNTWGYHQCDDARPCTAYERRATLEHTSRALNSGSVRSAMAVEAALPSGWRHTTVSSCHSTGTPSAVTCGHRQIGHNNTNQQH